MSTVAVIGGGISGLSCAYYLSTIGRSAIKKVILLESSPSLGGWVRSTQFPDGAVYEHGPRSIRTIGNSGHNALTLVEELGLSSDVISIKHSHPAAKNRYLLVNNKLHALPRELSHAFRINPPLSKPLVWYLLKDVFSKKKQIDDESCYDFISRRFGQEVADYFIDPLCRGIVAGDSKLLSVKSIFPGLFEAEQKHGSVIKGQINALKESKIQQKYKSELSKISTLQRWSMWSLKHGLQQLTDSLFSFLNEKCEVHKNSPCKKLNFEDKVSVTTDELEFKVDHIFASIPSQNFSTLLSSKYDHLAKLLSSIPSVHAAVVNLEFRGKVLHEQGFGFLVPSSENCKILGITFDSCCFPEHDNSHEDRTRITCMMGGHWFEELFGDVNTLKKETVLAVALDAASNHLGIKETPFRYHVAIHKNCIPQYLVGHHKKLMATEKEIKKNNLALSLIGSSYKGVSVGDCILNSKLATEDYLSSLNN